MRRHVALALALLLAAVLVPAAMAARAATKPPVLKQRDARFGNILARRDHKALYYWNVEKRDFKIHCTGACARAWPPLIVRSRLAVPRRIAGITGVFGTIRRPDGRLQVTRNRLPLYTYVNEAPYQVLCDDVDGWFVVRV
jgi:predicted lipoprotein with Yx(FWY)xxD motif